MACAPSKICSRKRFEAMPSSIHFETHKAEVAPFPAVHRSVLVRISRGDFAGAFSSCQARAFRLRLAARLAIGRREILPLYLASTSRAVDPSHDLCGVNTDFF